MKIVITLCVIQTLGIITIAWMLIQHFDNPDTPIFTVEQTSHNPPSKPEKTLSQHSLVHPLNESQIRQIIRTELTAALTGNHHNEVSQHQQKEVNTNDSDKYVQAKAVVSQEIDYFIANGEISHVEMSNLQAKIARLDSKGRKQMFGKLMSAMNSGQLEGQL